VTFLGTKTTVDGTITGSEPVTINGTFQGHVILTSALRVGPHALVDATLNARSIVVEGEVIGDISADEHVQLVSTARVDGNIRTPRIEIEDGAYVRGMVDMGSRTERVLKSRPA
jgi:cytoskeletal protein CcmA (bactofilin family)